MMPQRKGWGAWIMIGIVVLYMGFLIVAPITAMIVGAFEEGIAAVWSGITSEVFLQSLWLSLQIALLVVLFQALFGTIIAWVLVRQNFWGKSLLNGLVDMPFAVSPVVVGYMLLLLFGRNGFLFPILDRLGINVAFAVPGMFLATLFVSLPFMIREMIPAIENLDREQEYAAETLGANQMTIFFRIILPQLQSALIYGLTLTLARALGEFGAVLVIGGGVQGRTETTTLYIFRTLEERYFIDAYTAAIFLGVFSVSIVFLADGIRRRHEKRLNADEQGSVS